MGCAECELDPHSIAAPVVAQGTLGDPDRPLQPGKGQQCSVTEQLSQLLCPGDNVAERALPQRRDQQRAPRGSAPTCGAGDSLLLFQFFFFFFWLTDSRCFYFHGETYAETEAVCGFLNNTTI